MTGGGMTVLWRHFAELSTGRAVLWCYFIWYLFILVRYFEPNHYIWLTSVGLSLIIGTALLVNTTLSGKTRVRLEPWPAFRLFVTPFCVSSFSAIIKTREFILIFPPRWGETLAGLGLIALFCAGVAIAKFTSRLPAPAPVDVDLSLENEETDSTKGNE
jgi:hypothetical protein